MSYSLKHYATVLVLCIATVGQAQEPIQRDAEHGLVHFGSRVFVVGRLPSYDITQEIFIGTGPYPDLNEMRNNDPVLRGVSVKIKYTPLGYEDLFFPMERQRQILLDPDDPLNITGFEAWKRGGERNAQLEYTPLVSNVRYIVSCAQYQDTTDYLTCDVNVAFPHDQNVYAEGRWTWPRPTDFAKSYFDDIAVRLNEIMLCLDVTEEFQASINNIAMTPIERLEQCKIALTS